MNYSTLLNMSMPHTYYSQYYIFDRDRDPDGINTPGVFIPALLASMTGCYLIVWGVAIASCSRDKFLLYDDSSDVEVDEDTSDVEVDEDMSDEDTENDTEMSDDEVDSPPLYEL